MGGGVDEVRRAGKERRTSLAGAASRLGQLEARCGMQLKADRAHHSTLFAFHGPDVHELKTQHDTVTFQFRQTNHTVTQSTFAEPCVSLTETSTSGEVGFDSGL